LNDQEKKQYWEQRLRPVEDYVKQYTFPVLSSPDGENYELFGTSLGILISGKKYICTANHLIKDISKTRANVVIAVNGKFESLNLDTVISKEEEAIDYDICLVELNDNPDHVPYLHQGECYQEDEYNDGSFLYLQGFPTSKNKSYDIHDHKNKEIGNEYINLCRNIEQSIHHTFKGVSDKTHLFFKYDEGVYLKEDSADVELLKRQNMVSLRGLSGCGIWNINDTTDIPIIKLAGVFIAFKSGVGAGTKAMCILESNNWGKTKH